MSAKPLTVAELEAVYDLLSEAIDAVPPDRRELFLAKLALLLANLVGSPGQVAAAVKAAAANLSPGPSG